MAKRENSILCVAVLGFKIFGANAQNLYKVLKTYIWPCVTIQQRGLHKSFSQSLLVHFSLIYKTCQIKYALFGRMVWQLLFLLTTAERLAVDGRSKLKKHVIEIFLHDDNRFVGKDSRMT